MTMLTPFNLPPTLDYAHHFERRAVMPAGAVVLLSLALAGLGSVTLRGRYRRGLMAWLNSVIVAADALLFFTHPLFLTDDDYAGWLWLWLMICVLVNAVGAHLAFRDRRELFANDLPQATSRLQWMSLFWVISALAPAGIAAGTFTVVVVGFGFGGPEPPLIPAAAAIAIAGIFLLSTAVNTVIWLHRAAARCELDAASAQRR